MFENYILNSNPKQWGINLALDTKYYYIKFLLCFRELRVIQQDKIIIKFLNVIYYFSSISRSTKAIFKFQKLRSL